MKTKKIEQPRTNFRALVAPGSFSEEDLSFEVVWATDRAVFRAPWYDEPFDETLGMDPGEVRLDRLNSGAPLLNSHRSGNLDDQLGAVVPGSARVDGSKGYAKVQLLNHPSNDRTIAGVRAGIFTNFSVGFQVFRFRDTSSADDSVKQLRAVDWEPFELTLIPVPADFDAGIRSLDTPDQTRRLVPIEASTPSENMKPNSKKDQTTESGNDPLETRGAPDPTPAPAPAPAPAEHTPDPVDAAAVRAQAQSDERKRISSIYSLSRGMGLEASDPLVRSMVDEGTPLDGEAGVRARLIARGAAEDEATETRGGHSPVEVTRDEGETTVRGIETALLEKCSYRELNPSTGRHDQNVVLDENSSRFRGLRVLDLAKHVLRAHSVKRVDYMPDHEVAKLALRSLGATTSDFPNLLANVASKRLQMGFGMESRTWLPLVSSTRIAQDFKPMSSPAFGGGPALEEIDELGSYNMAKTAERGETFTVKKYGKKWGYSWEAMLADDLSAFDKTPANMGANAARKENDVVWTDLIIGNVVGGDGNALFDNANHANDTTAASPLTIANLGAAQKKLMDQTGLDAEQLNLIPSFLIVGTADYVLAQQLTRSISPDQFGNVNPFAGGGLTVIVDPRISFDGWYLTTSPTQTETLEIARLAGMDGPSIETRPGFDVDGLEIKVRHIFGAQIPEFRGWQRVANS